MKTTTSLLLAMLLAACAPSQQTLVTIDPEPVSTDYVGNGVQWDPYETDYPDGVIEISEADIERLYTRLDIMHPAFMRVMVNTSTHTTGGQFDPRRRLGRLAMILDYCQTRGVEVMFGDWGRGLVDPATKRILPDGIDLAARYTQFLVDSCGYDCIRHYNIVNEPNGFWSVTDGSYPLWAHTVREMQRALERHGIADRVKITGPDIAIWDKGEAWWIDSCATDLKGIVGLYDIHTYPSKYTVNSGEYGRIISAYRERVPEGAQIVMGEIGMKFIVPEDSLHKAENDRRIAAKPHASPGDSQMYVYDHSYGVDVADAVIQTLGAGFSGCVAWMLDDAMHTNETPDLLKIWGMWNILGEEKFGAEEEQVRPWFHAMSLLCRGFPAGATIHAAPVSGDPAIRAAACASDKGSSVAVLNTGTGTVPVRIEGASMRAADIYLYTPDGMRIEGERLMPENSGKTIRSGGYSTQLPPQSLLLITTIK